MAEALWLELRQDGPIPLNIATACRPGEVLALVGPSGSGKSTVLRSVAGLYRPAGGRITCDGTVWFDAARDIWVPPQRRTVGLVFQNYALFPHMTARANVGAALGHLPRRERAARATRVLGLVGLGGLERRRPAELSGGQQQRVAVARALARDPNVLLLDEPFSAVDRTARQRLHRQLAELRQGLSMPILLVTHDFDEAARLADRMCLLAGGRILHDGLPAEVLARPNSVEAARLVDLQNMSGARVARQAPEDDVTVLDWRGVRLWARHHPGLEVGADVTWAVPTTQVLLHDDTAGVAPNVVAGVVEEVVGLSEGTRILLAVDAVPGAHLTMTVPRDVTRRASLARGARLTVTVARDAIHVIGEAAPEGA